MKAHMLMVLVLLGLVCFSPSAFGYSLTVNDGAITFNGSNMGGLDLLGDGFRLTAPIMDSAGMMVCQFCSAGPQNLGASITISDLGFTPTIPMTVNGEQTALNIRSPGSTLLLTSTVMVPPVAGGRIDVSAPFTMTGRLNVMGMTDVIDLYGEGIATLRLYDAGPGGIGETGETGWYRAFDPGITYAFSSSPLISPEPASVALLGTGAAWLLRRKLRPASN
jgi:hypothetical protein